MSDPATKPDACDVCAGRESAADAKVTCSEHFLEQLGWPDYSEPLK